MVVLMVGMFICHIMMCQYRFQDAQQAHINAHIQLSCKFYRIIWEEIQCRAIIHTVGLTNYQQLTQY